MYHAGITFEEERKHKKHDYNHYLRHIQRICTCMMFRTQTSLHLKENKTIKSTCTIAQSFAAKMQITAIGLNPSRQSLPGQRLSSIRRITTTGRSCSRITTTGRNPSPQSLPTASHRPCASRMSCADQSARQDARGTHASGS